MTHHVGDDVESTSVASIEEAATAIEQKANRLRETGEPIGIFRVWSLVAELLPPPEFVRGPQIVIDQCRVRATWKVMGLETSSANFGRVEAITHEICHAVVLGLGARQLQNVASDVDYEIRRLPPAAADEQEAKTLAAEFMVLRCFHIMRPTLQMLTDDAWGTLRVPFPMPPTEFHNVVRDLVWTPETVRHARRAYAIIRQLITAGEP